MIKISTKKQTTLKTLIQVKKYLMLSMIFLCSCASRSKIELDWYRGEKSEVISRQGEHIKTDSARFRKFACLHFDEIIRLAKQLNSCQDDK